MERNNIDFRDLRADEIEVRIQSVKENGLVLLLYKNARVDMNILDETLGNLNWQRVHDKEGFCKVGIWNADTQQWVWKEDRGSESNTEAEKGLASDSFKRCCTNAGIGRELYTSPFIWVNAEHCNYKQDNRGNMKCYDKFYVEAIRIENKRITALSIKNADMQNENGTDKRVYKWQEQRIEDN